MGLLTADGGPHHAGSVPWRQGVAEEKKAPAREAEKFLEWQAGNSTARAFLAVARCCMNNPGEVRSPD